MPDFPLALMYLWNTYHRLRKRAGGNGFGPSPIEWRDIEAFNRLSGMALAPWEVVMLERLDDAFIKAVLAADARGDDDETPPSATTAE